MRISATARTIFRQLFERESCTYTYIIGCEKTGHAVIIDPVLETAERDAEVLKDLNLKPLYGLNTHVHADHITGTHRLKKFFPQLKSVLSTVSGGKADMFVKQGEIVIFGEESVEVRHTPGHTDGCVTYVDYRGQRAFTGDALLYRACGRTDFQQGSADVLYSSVWDQIFTLPDHFLLYIGHDYHGHTVTSVWEEKKYNPRLTRTREEFIEFMKNMKLDYPKQIDRALPANLVDGETETK